MIVKIVMNDELKDLSIFDRDGERIYYSDIKGEYAYLDKEIMHGQRVNYFEAHWSKGKVKITRMVTGYNF